MSLRLPAIVGYDPWVWLIWGRELTSGTLSSDGTIAWKPLPVLVTALLVPFGEAAPQLWLLVSRAVGLSGLVAVGGLAARLARDGLVCRAPASLRLCTRVLRLCTRVLRPCPAARRPGALVGAVAAIVAVVAFLLTPDAEARWLRHCCRATSSRSRPHCACGPCGGTSTAAPGRRCCSGRWPG